MRSFLCISALATCLHQTNGLVGGLRQLEVLKSTLGDDVNGTIATPTEDPKTVNPNIIIGPDIGVDDGEPATAPPTTSAPNSPPTPTPLPTPEPTPVPPPAPANDQCINAQPLTATVRGFDGLPEQSVQGTTVGATHQSISRCKFLSHTSPSVWYTAVGTGSALSVSTCLAGTDLDTKISVFAGSCNELVCLESNDDMLNPGCSSNSYASKTSWQTEIGVTYYILVHSFADKEGNFEIALESRNDLCELSSGVSPGDTIAGDTTKTQYNLRDVLAQCGYTEDDYHFEFHYGPWDRQPRGRWYKVLGTGNRMRVTTCQGPDTVFRAHRIHVFGADCNSCLGGNPFPRSCVTYEWNTVQGVTYHVVVHRAYSGYDTISGGYPAQFDDPPLGSPGSPFDLTISEVAMARSAPKGRPEPFD